MYAIYKGKRYRAVKKGEKIRIGSDTKEYGFTEYVDVVGNVHYDRFVKLLDMDELDYLYEERFEIQYQGRWFHLFTALNSRTIFEDYYEIILSFLDAEEKKLAEELEFERTDKFYYTKRIYRKDIEALKVIEIPQGIFSLQGKKERILEGQEIDDYFASIID